MTGLLILALSFFDNIVGSSFLRSYSDRSSVSVLTYLVVIYGISIGGQVLLVLIAVRVSYKISQLGSRFLNLSHILVFITLSINAIAFSIILSTSFQNQNFDLEIFVMMVSFNFLASIIIIGILLFKFFFWFRRKRGLFIFFYVSAFIIFFVTTVSAFLSVMLELEGRTSFVSPEANPWDRTSFRKLPSYDVYRVSSMALFGFIWLATAMMLRNYVLNYMKAFGWKYWILVSLPLIYYVVSSDFVLNQFTRIIFQFPYLTNFIIYIFGAATQVSGIFFAISFILMSKNTSRAGLKTMLAISASGMMMLFGSLQISVLLLIPYPPFGLSTLSMMPISAYLLLIGLYYSARIISYDKELLTLLKKHIENIPDSFLESIGSAEWRKDIEATVERVIEDSNVSPQEIHEDSNLSTEEIRTYVEDVLKTIRENKNADSKDNE